MKRAEMTVYGTVQCTGLRVTIRNLASKHGLKGEVENIEDGLVRVVCEGESNSIEGFMADLRAAEWPARVDDIRVSYSEHTGKYGWFSIITGDIAHEFLEGFSTEQEYLIRADQKQDKMLETQKEMQVTQKEILGTQKKMLETQKEILGTQKKMLETQKEFLNA